MLFSRSRERRFGRAISFPKKQKALLEMDLAPIETIIGKKWEDSGKIFLGGRRMCRLIPPSDLFLYVFKAIACPELSINSC